jgi:hypothetical protein
MMRRKGPGWHFTCLDKLTIINENNLPADLINRVGYFARFTRNVQMATIMEFHQMAKITDQSRFAVK